MKIETLRYFVVTAQSKTITESAQKLYMAQPSLTKALHNLEAEIGCPLFERSKEGIVLTEVGKKILPQAKQMVEYYNEWLELGSQSELKGLDIYVSRSYSDMLLPHILVKFRQRHPHIPVNFVTARNPDLYLSRSVKTPVIALFSCGDEAMNACAELQGCRPTVLLQGEFRCLVSRHSPLARQESVALDELKDHFLVLPGVNPNLGDSRLSEPKITHDIIAKYSSQHVITVEALSNVIAQVAENPQTYATSFYPALQRYRQVQSKELVSIPFRDYREPMNLCLFYSKQAYQRHPLVAELIDDIRDAFQAFAHALEP